MSGWFCWVPSLGWVNTLRLTFFISAISQRNKTISLHAMYTLSDACVFLHVRIQLVKSMMCAFDWGVYHFLFGAVKIFVFIPNLI